MLGVLQGAPYLGGASGKAYLAVDESIQIKSYKSLQTKAIHLLAPQCAFTRLLTGSAPEQGPHDLWGQLRAIGLYPMTNFIAFRGRYCIMGGWNDKEVLAAKNTDELASIMAPVVFQAKKKDWLPELPRKDFTIRDYEMSDEQQRQYKQMEHQFTCFRRIEQGVITVDVAIMTKYAKLAQIQCGFIYDEDRVVHELVTPQRRIRSAQPLAADSCDEEVSGKVCVVYRHRAMLPFLVEALKAWSPAWIQGVG